MKETLAANDCDNCKVPEGGKSRSGRPIIEQEGEKPAAPREKLDTPVAVGPQRTRSPSPTEALRSAGSAINNSHSKFVTNEIKTILRHNTARKAFFEFYRTLKRQELLNFWLDVELLNNDDAISDRDVFVTCDNIREKYFEAGTIAIYNDPMQNQFLMEWINNQFRSTRASLIKRTFFNHIQNYVAMKLFELACMYKFPDYMALWQNTKRSEQNQKGYVGQKLNRISETDTVNVEAKKSPKIMSVIDLTTLSTEDVVNC